LECGPDEATPSTTSPAVIALPGKVVLARRIHVGHFGCFAADQRTAGEDAALCDAAHHSGSGIDIELAGGEVIEEEQWFGALHQYVVDAHAYQVDADGVVAIELLGELKLGAHAVRARYQHRLAVAARHIEQAAKTAQAAHDLRTESSLDHRLDALDQRVAGIDVDACGAVGEGFGVGGHRSGRHIKKPIMIQDHLCQGPVLSLRWTQRRIKGRLPVIPWLASTFMRPRIVLIFLALVLFGGQALAQATTSPYAVTVPVADTTPANRDLAFTAALTQVLARANGGQDPRSKPGYADAMKSPGALVQQYQYKKGVAGAAPLVIEVSFDPAAVRRASGAADPTAGGSANALLVLVRNGQGQLLAGDALAPVVQAAQARGYQVVTADGSAPPAADKVAEADPATLAMLTAKYHTGLILQGTVNHGSADWTVITGGKATSWQDSGEADPALLANGANGAADRIERQLAGSASIGNSANVWVANLHSAGDYAAMTAALRDDPSVRSVNAVQADGDGVMLQVKGNGSLRALASGVGASGHLLTAGTHDGADVSLRWAP
jgi:hypothetical protein